MPNCSSRLFNLLHVSPRTLCTHFTHMTNDCYFDYSFLMRNPKWRTNRTMERKKIDKVNENIKRESYTNHTFLKRNIVTFSFLFGFVVVFAFVRNVLCLYAHAHSTTTTTTTMMKSVWATTHSKQQRHRQPKKKRIIIIINIKNGTHTHVYLSSYVFSEKKYNNNKGITKSKKKILKNIVFVWMASNKKKKVGEEVRKSRLISYRIRQGAAVRLARCM